MKVKALLLILLSVLIVSPLSAQKKNAKITISGEVVDSRQYPVSNAIIMIDGKNTSSVTDAKGSFRIKVKREANLIGALSFTNGIIEEQINGRLVINLEYKASSGQVQNDQPDVAAEEAVNVGYNYLKEKSLTIPVDKVDGTKNKYASYATVSEMIQEEVPGVKIDGGSVVIHGSKNLTGSVPALVVVDGVPTDNINNIIPSTVESIVVLKGSSASMYGTRGAGGVILITTR